MNPHTSSTSRWAGWAAGFVLLIVVLLSAGCRRAAPGSMIVDYPAPELSILTDENYQVIDMDPEGAGARAGIQIGDILVSMSPGEPQLGDAPTPTPFHCGLILPSYVDAQSRVRYATPTPVPLPEVGYAAPQPISPLTPDQLVIPELTAGCMDYYDCLNLPPDDPRQPCTEPGTNVLTTTVYFTEGRLINQIISSLDPSNRMLLRLLRNGQVVEIAVTSARPNSWEWQWEHGLTPTPVPLDYHYY